MKQLLTLPLFLILLSCNKEVIQKESPVYSSLSLKADNEQHNIKDFQVIAKTFFGRTYTGQPASARQLFIVSKEFNLQLTLKDTLLASKDVYCYSGNGTYELVTFNSYQNNQFYMTITEHSNGILSMTFKGTLQNYSTNKQVWIEGKVDKAKVIYKN